MGKRTYIFFFALSASATIFGSQGTSIPAVTITASHQPTPSLTSGPKQIVTREQIAIAGETSLSQTLQNLGGIQLKDTTGNGSSVLLSMRGFGANASSNTLVLVNGIPMTNPDMASANLNVIPINDIEYIEIIAGSESVLYGDQAVGGTINIITRQQAKKPFALSCSAGSYNAHECYAALYQAYRQLNFSATASTQHTDNYRDHNDYDQNFLLGNMDYAYASGRLHFNFHAGNEDMQFPGALTAQQMRQDRRQANNDTDFFKDWSGLFQLEQQQQLSANWRLTTDIARREMHGHGVLSAPFTQSRLIYFLKPTVKARWRNATLMAGADAQKDSYHLNSPFGLTDNNQQKYGLFGLAHVVLNPKLTVSLGARGAEQDSHLTSFVVNNNINRALATTLGATYKPMPGMRFYLRRAGSFRFPKADENASASVGVAGLRTQRGIAYESGMQWMYKHYLGQMEIYQLNLRDEIAFDPTQTPQQPFGANRNLAPTIRRGFTLSGKDTITDKITLDAQYNYVSARFQNGMNAGNRIPLVSESLLRAGLNYALTSHFTVYAEGIYTGNQYEANDDANREGKIGGYTQFNLNLRYVYEKLTASLHINNIFNRYYYFYTVFQPSMNRQFFYPAPGRNFTLTVKYLFA